jgi:hypothetical protein
MSPTHSKFHILLLSLVFSSATFATPITYSLTTSSSSLFDELTLTESGVQMDIWATAITDTGEVAQQIHQNSVGVGVYVGSPDGNETDGLGPDESLHFGFDQAVKLLSVTFTEVGTNDEFALAVDGETRLMRDIPGGISGKDTDIGIVDFSQDNILGNIFSFSITDAYDDYKLAGLTIDTLSTRSNQASFSVPTPQTLILMVGGLILLGLKHRQNHT